MLLKNTTKKGSVQARVDLFTNTDKPNEGIVITSAKVCYYARRNYSDGCSMWYWNA